MTDGIDPTPWPTPRGPWPEVHDLTRRFDHGQPWCVNAAGHPGDSDYPDAGLHVPWHECHGPQVWLDDVRLELSAVPLEVCVYLAAPFRFGQLRSAATERRGARLVLEAWDGEGEMHARLSVAMGEALRLARVLTRLVDIAIPISRAS